PRTWILLKDSVSILLEGTPKDVNIADLRAGILQLKNIEELHDLHVWSLTSGVNAMSAHIIISKNADHNEALQNMNRYIKDNFKITHTTLQLEKTGNKESQTHL